MGPVVNRLAAALAGLALLSGAAAAEDGLSVQAGDVRFDALAPQELPRGRCGLFLWARDAGAQPVFILTADDSPAQARVRANGDGRTLPRVSFEGDPAFGHFERQVFSDGSYTLDVDLRFDDNRSIRDGAVVRSGVIKLVNAEGWETIVPVGGMIACKR